MSIISLASEKVSRNAASQPPVLTAESPPAASKNGLTDALAAVAGYVPTEIIAAYTLTLAFVVGDKAVLDSSGKPIVVALPLAWFFVFLVLTPLVVWLVFAARSRERNQSFASPRLWPWWEAIAASIAFTVWSAALPKSAFLRFHWFNASAAAIVLLLASGLLPIIGAVVTKRTG